MWHRHCCAGEKPPGPLGQPQGCYWARLPWAGQSLRDPAMRAGVGGSVQTVQGCLPLDWHLGWLCGPCLLPEAGSELPEGFLLPPERLSAWPGGRSALGSGPADPCLWQQGSIGTWNRWPRGPSLPLPAHTSSQCRNMCRSVLVLPLPRETSVPWGSPIGSQTPEERRPPSRARR